MARVFSTVFLLVAALAVVSTSATLTDSEKFAAELKELKTEINKLEFVQAIEKSLAEASGVSSFAASSSAGSGSKASSVTAGSVDDDLTIEALPTTAPKSPTVAPSATSSGSSSGSKATATVVKTPAPTPTKTSGASTLAPAAAALATAVVYAML